jgi:nucleotide sugar dehydrogenase
MSSSILQIRPDDIDSVEKRGKYVVGIVGCGQAGALHACLFAEAGFKVICTDTDQASISRIARGKVPFSTPEMENVLRNQIRAARVNAFDIKTALLQSDIIIVTIPLAIDDKKKPAITAIERILKLIGSNLRRGSLVIVTNTVGINAIDGLIRETLENNSGFKVGADLGLAYGAIRLAPTRILETATNQRVLVAAKDQNSLDVASLILEVITKGGIRKTKNTKTAEFAALFEAVREDVEAGLVNEFAVFCEKTNMDFHEVIALTDAAVNQTALLPTLADGSAKTASYVMIDEAENLNMKLRITQTARETNEGMVWHVVNLAKDSLRGCGKALKRSKVSLLGVSQTANIKDSPREAVRKLAEALNSRGVRVSVYDPLFSNEELAEIYSNVKKNLNEAVEGADCLIILTAHDQFRRLNFNRLKVVMRMPASIVDFAGIVEPDKVEKAGFIYRGLGRGVWTK